MSSSTSNPLQANHSHQFDQGNPLAQKKILIATIFTGVMMVAEIAGGWIFNSMALLADGWHMSSHMLALGLAYVAYRAARHYANDPRFCFGTWKIEILAGYSSAILLMLVALIMCISSIERLFHPVQIHYNEAISIAILGLIVNVVCAWLLHDDHAHQGHSHHHGHAHHGHSHHSHHHHDHDHSHHEHSYDEHEATHTHHSHDLNQRAAFLHVIADALTSVLAIIALFAGKYLQWDFLDAILGIVGAILVSKWALGLIRQTGKILLEAEMDVPVVVEIKEMMQDLDVELADLHVWQVGREKFSCILAIKTENHAITPESIKHALSIHEEIVHASIEVNYL